jgi:hypothetical protein
MKPATPSEFTASDIEVITGISIDAQKDMRKRMAKAGLPPLGTLRGHWRYGWIDVCFLKLIEELKNLGLSLDNSIELVLREGADRHSLHHVFSAHLVGFNVAPDVIMYVPLERSGWTLRAVVSVRFEGNRPVGGDPNIPPREIFEENPHSVSVLAINISRLFRLLREHIEQLDSFLEDLRQYKIALRREWNVGEDAGDAEV